MLQDKVYSSHPTLPGAAPNVSPDSDFNKPNSNQLSKQVYVTLVTTSKYVIGAEVNFPQGVK